MKCRSSGQGDGNGVAVDMGAVWTSRGDGAVVCWRWRWKMNRSRDLVQPSGYLPILWKSAQLVPFLFCSPLSYFLLSFHSPSVFPFADPLRWCVTPAGGNAGPGKECPLCFFPPLAFFLISAILQRGMAFMSLFPLMVLHAAAPS